MASFQSRGRREVFGTMPASYPLIGTGLFWNAMQSAEVIPPWSFFPNYRDRYLRQYFKKESIFAGATYSITSRIKSLTMTYEGSDRAIKLAQDLQDNADFGNGWQSLLSKTVQDLLTQDNGFAWELVGGGNVQGELVGPVQEVNYLDPATIWRSYDPDFPVVYVDPITGERRKIHKSRLYMDSNMPQPDELARGVGFCGLSRLLLQVQVAAAILQYRLEKITGNQRRAILTAKGVNARTLKRALRRIQAVEDDEEVGEYEDIPIIASTKGVELELLALSGLPDNFDIMDETTLYVYITALALGTDAREFWPATQTGATKADASIQDLKSKGKGLADVITAVERAWNTVINTLPGEVEGVFDAIDDERDEMAARIHQIRVSTLDTLKRNQVIDPAEMRAIAIDEEIIPGLLLENIEAMPGMAGFQERLDLQAEEQAAQALALTGGQGQPPKPGQPGQQPPPKPKPKEDDDEADDSGERISASEAYQRSVNSHVRGLWKGEFGVFDFTSGMDSTIQRGLTRAVIMVAKEFNMLLTDMTGEEREKLRTIINTEMQYVLGFGQYVYAHRQETKNKLSPLLVRAKMWGNRFNDVQNQFRLLFGANRKFIWEINPVKEHCGDCIRIDGRIYRGSIFEKYDWQPQSSKLECEGWLCGCGLKLTDRPVTPGVPPKLLGKKKEHLHWLTTKSSFSSTQSLLSYNGTLQDGSEKLAVSLKTLLNVCVKHYNPQSGLGRNNRPFMLKPDEVAIYRLSLVPITSSTNS